jgi:ubiquinone/menaquinone biosynthesis C-methylase UbiE
MNRWETNSNEQLLDFLVGDCYGNDPASCIDTIRKDKEERAAWLANQLGLNKNFNVLEIGSGMGFTSKHIAKRVKHLYCCDISDSFLENAREECKANSNISFAKIEATQNLPFSEDFFDVIYSDAVFIHLNLYDIFWYFSEFKKVIKPCGIVWFNIMNTSFVLMDKLVEMANFYKNDPRILNNLLCWNSPEAIVSVASHFDFELESKTSDINLNLKFIKKNKTQA